VVFERTISVLEREKTVHALDRAVTAIGKRPDEAEIRESAAKMVATKIVEANKSPCDEDSVTDRFGWVTIGKCHIPFIFRHGEKFCAVRMVEMKLLNKYLSYLHSDIYSCTRIRSYYIMDPEERLLNEVNVRHCGNQFRRDPFTSKDLVVRLQEAGEFYNFLDVCYNKLLLSSSNPKDKCGFIRINGEYVVPYTVRDGFRYVPLFYFEVNDNG
jgi:hypothetical protein